MVTVGPNCLGTGWTTQTRQKDEKTDQKKKKGESEAERKAVPSIGERGRKKLVSFAPH